ncbi:MAG: cytoplasmic protein [Clostridia bacterium]|nr:cytoplasmic protein [Clostridia bacterium]
MTKVAIFAFRGDPMCFIHVLLNAKDMHDKGMEVKVVIEGESVKLLKKLEDESNPLYMEVKDKGLFHSICRACSAKLGVLEYNEKIGIPVQGDMNGHVSMADFTLGGYEVITL